MLIQYGAQTKALLLSGFNFKHLPFAFGFGPEKRVSISDFVSLIRVRV